MPNPYHDAEGKFCSKGEMQTAIEKAKQNGDFDTYFRLRTDMENIEAGKTTVDLSTISTLLPSITTDTIAESNDVAFLLASFNELNDDESKIRNRGQLLAAIVTHPSLSNEEQDELLEEVTQQGAYYALMNYKVYGGKLDVEKRRKLYEKFDDLNSHALSMDEDLTEEEKITYAAQLKDGNWFVQTIMKEASTEDAKRYMKIPAVAATYEKLVNMETPAFNRGDEDYVPAITSAVLRTVPDSGVQKKAFIRHAEHANAHSALMNALRNPHQDTGTIKEAIFETFINNPKASLRVGDARSISGNEQDFYNSSPVAKKFANLRDEATAQPEKFYEKVSNSPTYKKYGPSSVNMEDFRKLERLASDAYSAEKQILGRSRNWSYTEDEFKAIESSRELTKQWQRQKTILNATPERLKKLQRKLESSLTSPDSKVKISRDLKEARTYLAAILTYDELN